MLVLYGSINSLSVMRKPNLEARLALNTRTVEKCLTKTEMAAMALVLRIAAMRGDS